MGGRHLRQDAVAEQIGRNDKEIPALQNRVIDPPIANEFEDAHQRQGYGRDSKCEEHAIDVRSRLEGTGEDVIRQHEIKEIADFVKR